MFDRGSLQAKQPIASGLDPEAIHSSFTASGFPM
jgi:hypothetical protein